MSYDLAFWSETVPQSASASEIYHRLLEDEDIPGVTTLAVDVIVREFRKEFPDIQFQNTALDWEGANSYFEVTWPPDPVNAIFVSCGWQLLDSTEIMNRIIDVGNRLGCPLYDPQTDERYALPDAG